ncbi:MAG: HAD hydrolase-like protein [Balneolales bacterium]
MALHRKYSFEVLHGFCTLNWRILLRGGFMKYPLIIFDFDGTLADSVSWGVKVIGGVADQYGFKRICAEDLERIRGYDPVTLFHDLKIPVYKIPAIASHLRKVMAEKAGEVLLHAGVDEVLKHLSRKGVTMAVVSSNSRENVRNILGKKNVSNIVFFECGVSLWGKRQKLRKVLNASGFAPEKALYVGDEIRDLQAARTVHMAFGAVGWGFNRLDVLMRYMPEEVFRHVSDMFLNE